MHTFSKRVLLCSLWERAVMKILLTASGGGHTGYAVALAQYLGAKAEIMFIAPSQDTWTISKIEKYGKYVETLKGRGPRDPYNVFIPRLIRSFWQSLSKVKGDFDVLVSTGSNHSIPPAVIGKIKGLGLINIEACVRFTKASKSARILNMFSDMTVLQWEEQLELFRDGRVVGPFYEKPSYEIRDNGYILVTGGTWGFKGLYDAISSTDFDNVVMQTGRVDPEPYKSKHPDWTVFDFDPDLAKWMAGAKVVISHLGKTVIDASLTYRKPVVIAMNPEWTRTAGLDDAMMLAEKTNSILIDSFTKESIEEALSDAKKKTPPNLKNGAEVLARIILEEYSIT